jgi:hypothetical protein
MDGTRKSARARLVLDPSAGGMIEELLVDGEVFRPQGGSSRRLRAGTVIAWRVGKALVAVRLLEARGLNPASARKKVVRPWRLGLVKGTGLCLDAILAGRPAEAIRAGVLSCGMAIRVAAPGEFSSLADLAGEVANWPITERISNKRREAVWGADCSRLRLVWDLSGKGLVQRETGGRRLGAHPLYRSPLVRKTGR